MKRKQLFDLYNSLEEAGNLEGVKFGYAVAKNKRLIRDEVDSYNEAMKPSEDFTKYDKERIELCKKYANKDKNGNPIIKEKKFDLDENDPKFKKEFKDLNDKNEDAIKSREDQLAQGQKLLQEEITIELHKVSIDNVPDNITGNLLDKIDLIIE